MDGEAPLLTTSLLNGVLERTLCRILTHSPESRELLIAMTGKVIAIEAAPMIGTIYLLPIPNGVQLRTELSGSADLTLTGHPLALAKLGVRGVQRADLFSGEIDMAGDSALAELLARLFQINRAQWIQTVRELIGPLLMDQLTVLSRSARTWGSQTTLNLQQNLGEFLREEVRQVPSDTEAQEFLSEVDRLRDDCDRLEIRIERLRGLLDAD